MKQPEKTWQGLKLWAHQRGAAEMIDNYLQHPASGSALVRMPTGTGKTGVITVAVRCMPAINNALVLCPHAGLRDQLVRDVRSRFFERIGENAKYWPRRIEAMRPSTIGRLLDKEHGDGITLIATIQALQQIFRESIKMFARLRQKISLVVVDEGHREPAPEWAEAVRSLQHHTVLFTATPYRNDHRIFNVNRDHIFVFTHHAAVDQRFIREVRFHSTELPKEPRPFVKELVRFYENDLPKIKPSGVKDPRVIVRCEDRDSVASITAEIRRSGHTALGIHDRFPDEEDSGKARRVPDPLVETQTFWVHQFKLLEGIDEPDFCVLAVFDPLHNARSLVQQIGRIVRNVNRLPGQYAHVLCRTSDRQLTYWEGYRAFEQVFESDPDRFEIRQLFDTFLRQQPPYQYYDRDYRSVFAWTGDEMHHSFVYRASAVVFHDDRKVSLETLADELTAEWATEDADVRLSLRPDETTVILPYVSARNSPVLRAQALTELTLGYAVVRRSGKYLFFFDSQGRGSETLRNSFRALDPDRLECLFSGTAARISHISLLNTDVGRHSTRRRTIQAYSVSDTAPGLLDHAHFASTATGYTGNATGPLRRYVGFSRSRISDRSQRSLDFDEYVAWTDLVSRELQRQNHAVELFGRYARFSTPPSNPTPLNILLDIFDVMEEFHSENGRSLNIEDVCFDVRGDGTFELPTPAGTFVVRAEYDSARRRYILESEALQDAYQMPGPSGKPENIVRYLNRSQAIRVVTKSPDTVFAHGRFYRPRVPLTGPASGSTIDLLKILEPFSELNDATTEKGSEGSTSKRSWAAGSVFNLIDTRGHGTSLENEFADFDTLVCDDLQKEIADFIAAGTQHRRIAFIHAKAKTAKRSASALTDVCGQATKNLSFLSPYVQGEPPNIGLWDGPWSDGTTGKLAKRIRFGRGDSTHVWAEMLTILRDPQSSREVWLMLGKTLSRNEFNTERMKNDPAPETIQILFLLQSTWAAVASAGAKLRVFCSP